MKDKLDILIELLLKSDSYHSDKFTKLLNSVSHNSDAFLFLYEAMPEEHRPKLEDSQYFRDIFLYAISCQDEKTFNNYFFSGLHELLNVEEIRKLHFKFPENEKLKEYSKSKDNPKNIDEIVNVLSQLWGQNSEHYPEMLNRYLPKLQKLSEIKSKKSRAADYFAWWGIRMIKKDGLQKFFEFCQTIQLEPVSFSSKTGMNFRLEPENMKIEDLKFLINYGEKLFGDSKSPGVKSSYLVIEKMSSYAPITQLLNKLTKEETPENIDKFLLIWKTQQKHIKDVFNKIVHGTINPDKTETVELIQQVVNETFIGDADWHSDSNMRKSDIERIISWGKRMELEVSLPVKNEQTNNKKVKI